MKQVRAAVMTGPRAPIELREFPEPRLVEGSALLETLYSEVCGTDVHLWHGRLSGVPYPIIPGHISVGRIDRMRGAIRDLEGNPYREGDIVAFVDVHETCGACYYCLVAKESTRCPHRKVYVITYGVADGLLGGWSEKIFIPPGVRLLRLPDGLTPETYIGGGCGLVTAFHAIERAGIRIGDSVVVLGVGPVGQSAIAFATLSGAERIIAIGAPDDRLRAATRMGATETLSIDQMPAAGRLDAVRSLTGGRGADVVIEVAGAPIAVPEGAALCRDGGVLVVAGQYTDNGDASWNVHHLLNRKHLDVRGCWGSDYSHFHRAIRAQARHRDRFPWKDLISRRFSLDEANEALQAVESRALVKAAMVPGGGA